MKRGFTDFSETETISRTEAVTPGAMIETTADATSEFINTLDDDDDDDDDDVDAAGNEIEDVATEAIERVSPIAMRKGVPLLLESEKGIAIVSGDFFQLVSALANLVENAVKYSDQTHQVDVRVLATDATVSVEVEDRGIGIPADSIDRIFERFYRVDRARNRATGGTGLGLSIVRHVATNHGGEVNVRSREGEGSTFILQIPRVLRSV